MRDLPDPCRCHLELVVIGKNHQHRQPIIVKKIHSIVKLQMLCLQWEEIVKNSTDPGVILIYSSISRQCIETALIST